MINQACYVIGTLCILLFISSITVSHSFANNATKLEKNETRINNCRSWQFQCNSGQCIAKPFVCDGLKDCKDYSDETYDQCRIKTSITCKETQFQCQYGACIEKKYLCDGQKHCIDGSDESPDTCNVFRDQSNKKRNKRDADTSCAAPASSPDKTITYRCNKNSSSGTCEPVNGYFPEWTIATITCAPGYYPDNSEIGLVHTCFNSRWSPKVGKCVKKCDQLNPVNVVLECHRYGIPMGYCNGDSVLLAGTKVRPTCEPAYKYDYPPSYYEITCEDDGKWDSNLVPCVPECGKPHSTQAQLTIAGGTPESIGGSPWHVAIFNKDRAFICGGTIISETLVLSAAHCFSDGERTDSVDDFEVIIGKYTSNYTVKDNSHQKIMKIKEIRFSTKGYRGLATYHAADIAILILEQKIPISPAILPACLNWDGLKKKKYPSEDEPGKVVGWGYTENNTISTVLRNLTLPFISYQRCVDMVDDDFKLYVTIDKFCAGTRDPTGPTVLQGDSGGGLLFEEKKIFYLRGVVSVKQASSNAVAVFTDLSDYVDWIASVVQTEKKVHKNIMESGYGGGTLSIVHQTYDTENGKKRVPELQTRRPQSDNFSSAKQNDANLPTVSQTLEDIVRDIQSNNFSAAERKLKQGTDDTYKYVVKKLYNQQTANFELPLRFADFVTDIEQKFKLYDNLHNEVKNSNNQPATGSLLSLRKSVKKEILDRSVGALAAQNLYNALQNEIQETSVEPISSAFQNDVSWPTVKELSAGISDYCRECLQPIYNKVVEFVWSKVTVSELLRRTRNNLKNIEEAMAVHAAIFNKLKQSGTLNVGSTAALANYIQEQLDFPNYKNVLQVHRTDYEAMYGDVKMKMKDAAVGPISAALQNDTSWSTAKQLSLDIFENCRECVVDIYNEVVQTVWNKVPVPEFLKKVRTNFAKIGEDMAIHRVTFNKLKQTGTGTFTASAAAALASYMRGITEMPNYKDISQVKRSSYEAMYGAVKTMMKDVAVGPISAAFQNDTSWPTAKQLSADIYENCNECAVDVHHEVVEKVWNDVSVLKLLQKVRTNFVNMGEDMTIHRVIFNKLKQAGTFTADATAALASYMKGVMEMSKYKDMPQVKRSSYEEMYGAVKMIMKDAAVGPISAAFQNDTSWPTAKQLSADIYGNCNECVVDIYNDVVETVWNKVPITKLLQKVQTNFTSIREDMAIHIVIFNKLKVKGTLTASATAALAHYMKNEMDMSNYKNIPQDVRTDYEAVYRDVKMKIRELAVGPISAAFQNDTSWPTVKQLCADICDSCNKCIVDIYKEAIGTVWNKVTIPELQLKARENFKGIGEIMAVHIVILDKLKETRSLTANSAAALAQAMKEVMGWPNYKNVIENWRSEYEGFYTTLINFKNSSI